MRKGLTEGMDKQKFQKAKQAQISRKEMNMNMNREEYMIYIIE